MRSLTIDVETVADKGLNAEEDRCGLFTTDRQVAEAAKGIYRRLIFPTITGETNPLYKEPPLTPRDRARRQVRTVTSPFPTSIIRKDLP